jgi:hypothetical protein
LIHPGVGEEQRGIVMRDERRGMDFAMALLDKEVEEPSTYLRTSQHA